MNHVVKISKLQNILLSDKSAESNFFTKSYLHTYIVNLLVLNMDDNVQTNFEMLCEKIPKKIGSRSAILVVLHEGLELGFLLKNKSETDKRLRIYTVAESLTEHLDKSAEVLMNSTKNEKVL